MITRQDQYMLHILVLSILQKSSKSQFASFSAQIFSNACRKLQKPTSKTHINCLTASAVPWNHFCPASPGV